MTTPRPRSLVSLAAALTFTLALGACASAPSRRAADASAPAAVPAASLRFENESRDYVDVYLVGERREWRLARVAAGARAMLRIPDDALADGGRMRLAAIPPQRVTLLASSDLRAASALAWPMEELLAQQWTFSQTLARGQPAGLLLGRMPTGRQ